MSNHSITPNRTLRRRTFAANALIALLFTIPFSGKAATRKVFPSAGGEGIQQALDEVGVGGQVRLKQGIYRIHQPIILRQNGQTLRGAGPETILLLANNADCPVVILGDPMDKIKGPTRDVRLCDLHADGNRTHQQREFWRLLRDGRVNNNGVVVWDVDGAVVERVICSSCRSGGLVSSARARRLTVRDFTAYNNQFDGLACYGTARCRFSGLNLYRNLSAGISADLGFNHNLIEDAVLTDNDVGIFMRQSRHNVFNKVMIRHSHHDGVFMAQAGDKTRFGWRLTPGTQCIGNIFNKLTVSDCGGTAFQINNDSCTNNAINGGQFLHNAQGLCHCGTNLVTVNALTLSP
jgi:hypothetical protein